MKDFSLYNDDVIEVLRKLPSESVDCVITDPPYKVSQEGKKGMENLEHYRWERRNDTGMDFGKWDRQWHGDDEYFAWCDGWFKEIVRVCKVGAWVYIFFDKQKIGIFDLYLAKKYGMIARTIYVWVKTNPVPSIRKINWNSGTEFIWVGSKGKSKLKNFKEQKYMSSYYISPNASAHKETNHPAEKPKRLIRHLVEVNSNPGEIVLDCFMGSGTVGAVCKELGRGFIGIEKDKEYFDIAKGRIERAIFQKGMAEVDGMKG